MACKGLNGKENANCNSGFRVYEYHPKEWRVKWTVKWKLDLGVYIYIYSFVRIRASHN